MHIGAAIRHTRETLRLKLEMVALDAGFDPGNLSRIETGRQNPSIPRLEAIARAMEVTVADLYALVEPPRSLVSVSSIPNCRGRSLDNSEWVQIRRSYEILDSGRRQLALEFLQLLQRQQEAEDAATTGLRSGASDTVLAPASMLLQDAATAGNSSSSAAAY